ncbi:MAG: glycosyltransferase [Planctomycetes bacterium]|nr:glycosyltransferase [Planctomycetota bacterium]
MSRALDLLVVYEKQPEPRACGSDLRLVQLVEELARAGHRVHFLGRNPGGSERDRAELEQLCERVHGPDPERIHWGTLPEPALDITGLLRAQRFDLVLFDQFFWTGLSVTEQYLPLVRALQPQTPVIVVSDDCHWLREERRAEREHSRNALERARALSSKERWTLENADLAAAITPEDLARLQSEFPAARLRPLAFCQSEIPDSTPGFDERAGLVFLGSGGNEANVQGLAWFLREVWPLVRAAQPALELSVVGVPPASGWGAEGLAGVRVLGRLDELAPVLEGARVFVSPVAWGTGIKTKNVQAIGHGLPLVLNAISAEGMQLEHDRAAFVREEPAAFAEAVLRLHEQRELWESASAAALAHARNCFGRERVAHDLGALIEEALASPARSNAGLEPGPGTQAELRFPQMREARKLSERYSALVRWARELLAQGRLDEALQQLRNVFCELACSQVSEQVYLEPHVLLTQIYTRRGEYDEAAGAASEALRLLPAGESSQRPVLERVAALAGAR